MMNLGQEIKPNDGHIGLRDDAEEEKMESSIMIKDENVNSSKDESKCGQDESKEAEDEDEDQREQTLDEDNTSSVTNVKSNHETLNDTTTIKTTHLKQSSQNYEQLLECKPNLNESEIISCQENNSNHQTSEEILDVQQDNGKQKRKVPHSSEAIPKSHQTLKMRLKLRAPAVQNDSMVEVKDVKPPTRRKRGRQSVPIKKETKKLTQIGLGNQADRWQDVKNLCKGFKFHSQVAKLLLDCFDALLDGSLQWSTNSAHMNLKSRLFKILANNKIASPNDSWSSQPKKVVYKEDSKEELDDETEVSVEEDFKDQPIDEDYLLVNHSTDEDYLPDRTIRKHRKRLKPQRRKQISPRRTIMVASHKAETKRVQPLKVILSKNKTKDNKAEVIPKAIKLESGRNRKRRQRNSDVLENPHLTLKPPPPPIPPEFATYPKVFKCRQCPSKSQDTYPTMQLLKVHFDTHLPPKKKYTNNMPPLSPSVKEETEEAAIQRMAKVLIHCPDCKKLFFPGRLVQHLKTAHVRVLCDECGGMFSRVAMWEHKKAHRFKAQGKKPYKCDKCDKEFLWQVSLRQHRELHSKERPFICSACGKSFKTLTKMKRHEIIHSSVKPYICPHCHRSFTQQTNLKTHVRTHTGEKPYKCDYCAKRFTHKVSMKTHMKKEHGIDLWRDGPSHRVQEFDDVRCQMKRRKNPETKSIQSFLPTDMEIQGTEISAGMSEGRDTAASVIKGIPIGDSINNSQHLHQQEQKHLEQRQEYQEHRISTEDQQSLLEEQRGLEHRLSTDRRIISDDPSGLETRPQRVAGSPQEMVEIALSDTHHTNTQVLDHRNSDHSINSCISLEPRPRQCDAVPLQEDTQASHAIQRGGPRTTLQPESLHYAPNYLPVSANMSHLSHHLPISNTSQNQSGSRYSSNSQSGYSPASAMHPNIRQGPLHHGVQQGNVAHQHPATHHHPRYPSWAPSQAGLQGYVPGGEMSSAVLSELMKLGK